MRVNIGIAGQRSNFLRPLRSYLTLHGRQSSEALGRRPHQGERIRLFTAVLSVGMAIRLWNISWGFPTLRRGDAVHRREAVLGEPGVRSRSSDSTTTLPVILHPLPGPGGVLRGGPSPGSGDAGRVPPGDGGGAGSFMTGARLASALLDAGTVGLVWITAAGAFRERGRDRSVFLARSTPCRWSMPRGQRRRCLAFFLMLALRKSLSLTGHSGARDFAAAGALIGLAASTKYTGALFLAVPAFAVGADFIAGTARTAASPSGGRAGAPRPAGRRGGVRGPEPGIIADPTRSSGILVRAATHGVRTPRPRSGGELGRFYLLNVIGGRLGFLFLPAPCGMIVSAAGKNPGGVAIAAMAIIYITSSPRGRCTRNDTCSPPSLSWRSSVRPAASGRCDGRPNGRPGQADSGRSARSSLARSLLRPFSPRSPSRRRRPPARRRHRQDRHPDPREGMDRRERPTGSIIVSGPFGIAVPDSVASVCTSPSPRPAPRRSPRSTTRDGTRISSS